MQPRKPRIKTSVPTPSELAFYGETIDNLISQRKAQGLRQGDLDFQLGVSDGYVAKWESKCRLPSAFYLMLWCEALGLRLQLLEHDEE